MTPISNYHYYSNGAFELKDRTKISETGLVTTEKVQRKITGPIPRQDIAKLVEHIDPNSPTWQQEMEAVLTNEQFIVCKINDEETNSDEHAPKPEMGMTKMAYIKSYFTLNTLTKVAAGAWLC